MLKLGFCITGSFCSMDDMLIVMKELVKDYEIEVFLTPHVNTMDTRFYSSHDLKEKIKEVVKKNCIRQYKKQKFMDHQKN